MYSLINEYRGAILQTFRREYVNEYLNLLVEDPEQVRCGNYQREYRRIWRLNQMRLSAAQWRVYFERLGNLLANRGHLRRQEDRLEYLRGVLREIFQVRNGRRVLAFSACTKLFHIVFPRTPIFDSRVCEFYHWQAGDGEFERRLEGYVDFYQGVTTEYRRIRREGLLAQAIEAFRQQFDTNQLTDEKIIDFLIWSWVGIGRSMGFFNGRVALR